jgi:hypothetical protein
MKSRPAALRHSAGGMTSNGHDQMAGQHGNEPTRRAHHRTVSLTHGKQDRTQVSRSPASSPLLPMQLQDGFAWAHAL